MLNRDSILILTAGFVVTAIILAVTFNSYHYKDVEIGYINAGLEECPVDVETPSSARTIWVKSCKEYMTEQHNIQK